MSLGLESLKSVFSDIAENKANSTDGIKTVGNALVNEHSFGTNGTSNTLIKIDGISSQQQPSPLTAIYGDGGATVNGHTENTIQINDYTNGVFNLNVESVEENSNIVKNEQVLTIRKDLGDKKGLYNIKSLFDTTHGSTLPTPPTARSPLESDLNLFAKNPHEQISTPNLDIRAHSTTSRNGFLGKLKEPYIVRKIPDNDNSSFAGSMLGYNRDRIPLAASLIDVGRLSAFYTSLSGLELMLKENITNIAIGEGIPIDNPLKSIMAPAIPVPNTGFLNFIQQSAQGVSLVPGGGSIRKPFRVEYSARAQLGGMAFKNLGDRPLGLQALAKIKLPQGSNFLAKLGRKLLKPIVDRGMEELVRAAQIPKIEKPTPFIDLSGGGKKTSYDDKVGRSNIGDTEAESLGEFNPFKKGDFYVKIKDLRDGQFMYFRGFVTGITENVTPTFNPISYVGRSEDVYVYQKGERDISFNLRVYPYDKREQLIIYKKLEKLTSLAYPEYFADQADGFTRMKPPFTELYMAHIGTKKEGQFGFFKSISYTVVEQGDWDAERSLPRLFDIALSYQILSKRPPSLRNGSDGKGKFYGAYGE